MPKVEVRYDLMWNMSKILIKCLHFFQIKRHFIIILILINCHAPLQKKMTTEEEKVINPIIFFFNMDAERFRAAFKLLVI